MASGTVQTERGEKMARLIDADAVVTIQVYDDMTEETDTKKMTIAEAIDEWSDEGCPPTVDAVPVVRCKDCVYCKRFNDVWHLPKYDELLCTLCVETYHTTENDYCSWGERREDGKTN